MLTSLPLMKGATGQNRMTAATVLPTRTSPSAGLDPAAVQYDEMTGEPLAIDDTRIEAIFGVK